MLLQLSGDGVFLHGNSLWVGIIKAPTYWRYAYFFVKLQSNMISSTVKQIMAPIIVIKNCLESKIKNKWSTLNDWLNEFLCALWAECALEACLWWIVHQGLWCLRLVWSSGHILKPLWARSWCSIWNIILFACAPLPYSYSFHVGNLIAKDEWKGNFQYVVIVHVYTICTFNANCDSLCVTV